MGIGFGGLVGHGCGILKEGDGREWLLVLETSANIEVSERVKGWFRSKTQGTFSKALICRFVLSFDDV